MFPETRKILGSSLDYVRTQAFNKYAKYNFMSTTFTVLYPGASIRPHFGPTNYKYRIHLCLGIDSDYAACHLVGLLVQRFCVLGKSL